jgi:hypothetical protein
VIHEWFGSRDDDEPGLLGVDRDSLYYDFYRGYDSGILAVPLGGGAVATVVPNAARRSKVAISRSYLYWVDFEDPTLLLRAPKKGGPIETIWNQDQRHMDSLVVDECNLYWTVANPSELFIRSH